MLFDREDEFLTCNGRLPTRDHHQDRREEGRHAGGAAVDASCWAQGAYADIGAVIARNASYCSLGPYRIPHARIDAYLVYTNRQPGGGFRGLGIPQVAWAGEQQMDRVARELGIDPLELRRKNILRGRRRERDGRAPAARRREGVPGAGGARPSAGSGRSRGRAGGRAARARRSPAS